jgi:DNA-binding transcriptional MocR family regulator
MKKYEIVIDYIIRIIQTGNFRLGEFLPSIRTISKALDISAATVFEAYCRLERNGLVISEEQKGFRLMDTSTIPALELAIQYMPAPISDIQRNHYDTYNAYRKPIIQLGSMAPPNNYFPNEDLSKCLARVARTYPDRINKYGFSTDIVNSILPIEQITAKYMFKTFGIMASEAEVCHANGATEGLFFVLSTIAKKGDRVLMESPGFLGAYNALRRLYLEPVEIESLPPYGFNLDQAEKKLNMGVKPVCVIVTPNFQNPTGSLMPLENRKRLLHLCKKHNVIVIEDDTLGALRFGDRVPSLKELMPDDVIYISSYSKTMAPGYRVGWIAGGKYAYNIRIMQGLESFVMTISNHLAVAEYLESGKFKPYINNLRLIYKENARLMIDALKLAFPGGTEVFRPEGGQYIWVTLPKKITAVSVYFEAQKNNILLAPGVLFNGLSKYNNCLRFCCAMEMTSEVYNAIEIVGRIAKETLTESKPKNK